MPFSRQKSGRYPVPISLREDLFDLVIVISTTENMGTISKPPVKQSHASQVPNFLRMFEEKANFPHENDHGYS